MTYLQHTMTQNIYYYSQREEGDHSEESLDQSKEKPYMEKYKFCSSVSNVKGLRWLFLLNC